MPEGVQGHWVVCSIDGDEPMVYEVCDTKDGAERCRQERIAYMISGIEYSEHEKTGAVWTDRYRAYLRKEFERRVVVVYQDADGRLEDIELIDEPLYGFSADDPRFRDGGCDGGCDCCGCCDECDDDDDYEDEDDDEEYELTEDDIESEYWIVCDISADGPNLIKVLHCKSAAEAFRKRMIVATLDAFKEAGAVKKSHIWTEEYRRYLQGELERRYVVVTESDFRDGNIELITDPVYGP